MAGPLQGIKVLDISRFIAGPYCSMLLADMGAEVIKAERAGKGEDSRGMLPFVGEGDDRVSLYYTQYNKNKRGVTVNFRDPRGMELIKGLIPRVDVLVENFRPGTLDKMGLTKETLEALNPGLVVVSISGFGQTGPYRDRAAFDCIGQAMGGIMGVTGTAGGDPLLCGTWIGDFSTGIYAAFGAVCALLHRQSTGEGQTVDLSLVECVTSLLATAIPLYTATGRIQPRRGNRDNVTGPANQFQTLDGYLYMHAGTDPLFRRFAALIGRPELLDDPRYATADRRMEHIEDCERLARDWMSALTTEQAEELLIEAGIPASRVATVADIVANPQLRHREAIVPLDYPGVGEISVSGVTVKLSKTPGAVTRRPPLLGEHNREVYGGLLGLSDDEIDRLSREGVI